MDTQVVIQTGNWKVKVILGLGGLATLVILAFMYRVEVGAIILLLGSIGAIRLGFWARNKYTLEKLQERQLVAQTQQAEAEARQAHWRMRQEQAIAQKMAYDALFVERKAGTFVIGDMPFRFYPTATASAQLANAPLALPAPVDLLTTLDRVQRGLIVGASDTGKTTILQWLVTRSAAHVVVIDPHAYPGKYPAGCKVVGGGRNYAEIDRTLAGLVRVMTQRYDEIGRGVVAEMAHKRITVLIDEWRAITGNLGKSASDAIKTLLTESRKAAFSVFVASHSDRAEPLGLKGEYDLKDGFVIVKLAIVNGQRQATVDMGSGEVLAILPGPFVVSQPVLSEPLDLTPAPVEPTEQEQQVLDLKQAGVSNRDISQVVWGEGKFGQFYNQKIDDILAKFGEK